MNNTIKKLLTGGLLIVSFTSLFCAHLYSQKKNFQGYYIGRTGDTVKGIFPNYSQWIKNPAEVEFIPSATSSPIELTPENTLKFYIENYDTYLTYSGPRMINPIDFEQAIANKDTFGFPDKYATISTFLRLVAKTGNLQVFTLNDNVRTNFFYRLNNDALQELKYKVYYDQNRVNEVYEYRQQLYNLFKKEIEKRNITVDMEKIEYTDESLSNLLEKLTPVERRKQKVKNPAAGLVVAAGVTMNFFKVTGEKTIEEVNTKYNTSFSPLISIGYMSPLNRSFGKIFVYPQLKLYNYENQGEVTVNMLRKVSAFKTSLVAAPVLNVGGNIVNTDNYKFFVSGGGGIIFLFNNREQDQSIVTYSGDTYQTSEIKMAGLTYNANFSTGVTFKNKVIATATYNVPVSVANFEYYTPYYSSMQLTVGYKL